MVLVIWILHGFLGVASFSYECYLQTENIFQENLTSPPFDSPPPVFLKGIIGPACPHIFRPPTNRCDSRFEHFELFPQVLASALAFCYAVRSLWNPSDSEMFPNVLLSNLLSFLFNPAFQRPSSVFADISMLAAPRN